jgi:hypothetical protein
MISLIELNRDFLDQALSLLGEIDPVIYTLPCREVFSSSIGQHLRHCVEHYDELFIALSQARVVNYDQRPRDLSVETDQKVATARLLDIRERLASLPGQCMPLKTRDAEVDRTSASSLCRELQFLASHTVHHFALISVIASLNGLSLPANFGIAPATLKSRQPA